MVISVFVTFALTIGSIMAKSIYPLALTFMMFLSLASVNEGSFIKYIFPTIQALYTGHIVYLFVTQNNETSMLFYLIVISGLTLLLMLPAIIRRPAPSEA